MRVIGIEGANVVIEPDEESAFINDPHSADVFMATTAILQGVDTSLLPYVKRTQDLSELNRYVKIRAIGGANRDVLRISLYRTARIIVANAFYETAQPSQPISVYDSLLEMPIREVWNT